MNELFARGPFLDLVDVRNERRDRGSSFVTLQARPEISNTVGDVHGGAIATLLDVAMAGAAQTMRPEEGVVTVSMSLNFLRPGRGLLQALGKVRRAGRSVMFCDGEVVDEGGKLVATGMATFNVRRRAGNG